MTEEGISGGQPERLDVFMGRANAAYYATHDPFRDFTTAPEISQVFGEILGLWSAIVWQSMGRPSEVILAEAGPGRGTLMADALRAIGQMVPDFRAALSVHFVETSPALRAVQAGRVKGATWHNAVADLPEGPLIVLGNEFLDALPIRQFVRRGAAWAERFVAGGRFVELPSAAPGMGFAAAAGDGETVEYPEAAHGLVGALAGRLARSGGAALFIDYGPEQSAPGDSLQALQAGKPADPLVDPGAADLTAHVDFAALAQTAQAHGAAVHGPIPQGVFLSGLGLVQRTGILARGQTPQQASALMQSASRLIEPDMMGRLFKAMAILHPALPVPPGFPA